MPTNTHVNELKINRLTEAQYDAAVQAGIIGENELSIITDMSAGDTIQVDTMPTAAVSELGKIYQFVGTTDANYTNGYFYKCVSDGQDPATYSWTQTDVQPQAGGLPSQTGNAGKFLTTDGTDASWSDKPLVNVSTSSNHNGIAVSTSTGEWRANNKVVVFGHLASIGNAGVAIGYNARGGDYGIAVGETAQASGSYSIAIGGKANYFGISIGYNTNTYANYGICIGWGAQITASNSIQISMTNNGYQTNSVSNTVKIANANGNFEMMSADGTIPTDRFTTTPSADGTYVPTLTISSGVATRTWAAPGGGGSVPTLTWYTVSTAGNTLTIADTSSAQLVKVYKNGLLLQPTEDYTISGTTLTTVTALVVGDKITTEVF